MIDLVNPVLAKDVRQGLRTAVFAVIVHLSLGAAMLLAVYVALAVHALQRGPRLAGYLLTTLAPLLLVVVPLATSMRASREASGGTFDLAKLAEARPGSIVTGLFLASALRSTLLVVLAAPFLMFAHTIGFAESATDATLVVILWLQSLVLIALGVLTSSMVAASRVGLLSRGLGQGVVMAGTVGLGALAIRWVEWRLFAAPVWRTEPGSLPAFAAAAAMLCAVLLRCAAEHHEPVGTRRFLGSQVAFLLGLPVVAALLHACTQPTLQAYLGRPLEFGIQPGQGWLALVLAGAAPALVAASAMRRGHDSRIQGRVGWPLETWVGGLLLAVAVYVGALALGQALVGPLVEAEAVRFTALWAHGLAWTGIAALLASLADPRLRRPADYWAWLLAVGASMVLASLVSLALHVSFDVAPPPPLSVMTMSEALTRYGPRALLGAECGVLATLRWHRIAHAP